MKRIVICSDFLSTSDKEQLSNLPWLKDVLRGPLMDSTGIEPVSFSSREAGGFSRGRFFERSSIHLDSEALQFDYPSDKVSEESIAYLKEYLSPDDLIVGYELSRKTRAVLAKYGFTYIDIWLHPVRFLDDILFGFSSNNKDVFDRLAGFNYSDEHFSVYAARQKVSTYKGYKRTKPNIPPGSALLVGQTSQDKAVLQNGKFLTLLDFKAEIEKLAETHSKLYFSRHPYETDDEKILGMLRGIKNVELTEVPAYVLLSQDNLVTVAGISSSVVVEGKYFGKETQFFHKPIFEMSTQFGPESYVSILQDFMFGHFWSDVLSPMIKTRPVNKIDFLDKKDKLRDMLGFYWSHKHLDKTEMMRGTLTAVDRKVQRLEGIVANQSQPKKKAPVVKKVSRVIRKTFRKDPALEWASVTGLVDEAEVVSFDVFDTLLVRPLEHPNDLFDIMEPQVKLITRGAIDGNFRDIRQKARGWVQNSTCGEEVSLEERYNAIGERFNLTQGVVQDLLELELKMELAILRPREYVASLYHYAVDQGKRVVIVSDTFFSKAFLEKALSKNGFESHELLWASSETKLLKHTGNIYPELIKYTGASPERILHIGDNSLADIQRAEEHGIQTLHLPRTVDLFKEKSGLDKSLNFSHKTSASVVKGLIGNQVMDNPLVYSEPSHSGGDRYLAGYSMLGPMFFGFARWVLSQAIEAGVQKVFFLARDGEIVKNCYDEIIKSKDGEVSQGIPKSEYLHVSRRALSVPSIKSIEDIREISRINFSPTPVGKMLNSRFGLDPLLIGEHLIKQAGFDGVDDLINSNRDGERFEKLAVLLKSHILTQARIERDVLMEYLASKGFDGQEKTLIVDIGHNGTLQKRLNHLFDTTNIGGLYFVTQAGIKETILDSGMEAKGYVAEQLSSTDKRHPYNKYLLMFEACFLNQEGSMISFSKEKSGAIKLNQLPVDDEIERMNFIKEVHSGVLDFVKDVRRAESALGVGVTIQGRESLNPYLAMLNHPYELDVELFNGVSFENVYSGRDRSYLVKYNPEDKESSYKGSYWSEGLDVCHWDDQLVPVETSMKGVITKCIHVGRALRLVSNSKFRKFQREPLSFFLESRVSFIRNLAKYF